MKLPRFPKLSQLSVRERLLTAGVLFVVSVLLLDRVVLGPWWRHVREVNERIEKLGGTTRMYRQLLERKPQIMAEVEAYSSYLSQIRADPGGVATLLREIERLGKESGVALGEVKPLPPEENEAFQEYSFEIHTTGTFKQWIHFAYLLQSSTSLFQIERATVGVKEPGASVVDGSIRLIRRVMKVGV